MNREHYTPGKAPDWSRAHHAFRHFDGAQPTARKPRRRRNQYTPIVERGWFLLLLGAAGRTQRE